VSQHFISRLFGFLFAIALVVYPVAIYYLLDSYGLSSLAALLAVLLLLRIVPLVRKQPLLLALSAVVVAIFFVVLYASQSVRLLMLYPTMMSIALMCAFAFTVARPPSMIERFSRAAKMDIPSQAIPYMRALTLIWCAFFAINALISAILAWLGVTSYWALYNGCISYLLIGLLLVSEYFYRQRYRRRHGIS
jgi:uncharacterized membrane protein